MARAALILMENGQAYSVPLLARSALESMFNLVAAVEDRTFGPQRIAHELEEMARKLKFLLEQDIWPASRRPTPDDCLKEASRIRAHYSAPAPLNRADRDRVDKIEQIARTSGLLPYYDDDYRQLSLTVHGNQAGILNAASGFLVKKACSLSVAPPLWPLKCSLAHSASNNSMPPFPGTIADWRLC